MNETLALLLAGTLTFVFGWNNSSILIGNERGSGTLSGRESTILCSIGMLLGLLLEGTQMRSSLGGDVVGQVAGSVVIATLAVSVVFTLGLTLGAIPVSFSNTMVGAFVGAALATSLRLDGLRIGTTVAFWMVAPLATMALAFSVDKALERWSANWSLLRVDAFNRAGVGLVSVALAYVLSANNIGLIYGTAFGTAGNELPAAGSILAVLALVVCAVAAMAMFGRGNVAGTVGDRLLSLAPRGVLSAFAGTIVMMWLATELAIPISVSQCLIGGMFGAAFTKKLTIINQRLALEVVASWVAVPLAALVVALVVTPLL